MQVTISTVYDLPDIQHMPKHRMEFLDYKAGVKQALSPDNPFNKVADDPPKDFFYEMGAPDRDDWLITSEQLFFIIEQVTSITEPEIKEYSRKQEVVKARHLFSYFMSLYSGLSLKAIGKKAGGRDHTTVIHAKQTIRDLIDTKDTLTLRYIRDIKAAIMIINSKSLSHVPEAEIHQEGGEYGTKPDSQA